jgi:hypothetical protein
MYVIANHTLAMLHKTATASQYDVTLWVKRQKMPLCIIHLNGLVK